MIFKNIFKTIFFSLFFLMIASCSTISDSSTYLNIKISNDERINNGEPFSVIVENNADYESFVSNDYQTISQKVLNDNVNIIVIEPKKNKYNEYKIHIADKSVAIYFIFKNTPNSQWKFFIKDPSMEKAVFRLLNNRIIKEK